MYIEDQRSLKTLPFAERRSLGNSGSALGEALSYEKLLEAIKKNTDLSKTLGWDNLQGAISSWILKFNDTPTPEAFAQAVANWQKLNCLPDNGILDFNTWLRMLCTAKAGLPISLAAVSASLSGRIPRRPHGLKAVLDTFGNPVLAGFGKSITKVSAPAGETFTKVGKTEIEVHTKLKQHFQNLFDAIHKAGLWKEIYPSSGTFVPRTKTSYRQKKLTRSTPIYQVSTHSWGITIDIRAEDYPRYTERKQYAGIVLNYPPIKIVRIFQEFGFHWGLWFMKGDELDAHGRINFAGADPHHFQFATGF
jgi:hypothetical protein